MCIWVCVWVDSLLGTTHPRDWPSLMCPGTFVNNQVTINSQIYFLFSLLSYWYQHGILITVGSSEHMIEFGRIVLGECDDHYTTETPEFGRIVSPELSFFCRPLWLVRLFHSSIQTLEVGVSNNRLPCFWSKHFFHVLPTMKVWTYWCTIAPLPGPL